MAFVEAGKKSAGSLSQLLGFPPSPYSSLCTGASQCLQEREAEPCEVTLEMANFFFKF